MTALKHWFEKPGFVLLAIAAAYLALFFGAFRHEEPREAEHAVYQTVIDYSQSTFPPKIELIRNHSDWGHLGYYALMGRLAKLVKGDLGWLRLMNVVFMLLAFFAFVRLGYHYTYHNRLNPLWISFGLVLFAVNPYALDSAMRLDYAGLFLFLLLAALLFFEKENLRNAAIFVAAAVLVDWRAVLLSAVFVSVRFTADSSRLIRPERGFALMFPFLIAALPLLVWKDVVPAGEVAEAWAQLRSRTGFFRVDGLFYALVLIPLYVPWYSWSWGARARVRALTAGAIATAVFMPLYFIFPIRPDDWSAIRFSLSLPLGLMDRGALALAGEYKNVVLFVPWLAGTFLFAQLVMRDILDQTKALRQVILLLFVIQLFTGGLGGAAGGGPGAVGDRAFLVCVPFLILFTLSEAMVGEEGKLI